MSRSIHQRLSADLSLGAIPRPHTNTDLARHRTRRAAGSRQRNRHNAFGVRRREAMAIHHEGFATDADGLLAEGQEYRRGGDGLSWWRVSDSRHRSRGHRGLRLADVEWNHVRAAEVPPAA